VLRKRPCEALEALHLLESLVGQVEEAHLMDHALSVPYNCLVVGRRCRINSTNLVAGEGEEDVGGPAIEMDLFDDDEMG
jgi:hypothetical protein